MAIERIPGIAGHSRMSADERALLLSFLPDFGAACEVGTYDGATCRWLADARPGVSFLCVDPYVAAPHNPAGEVARWIENRIDNMTLYVGSVVDLAGISQAKFDWILVDGCHREPWPETDIAWALSRLKTGGALLVHDVNIGDVKRAILDAPAWLRNGDTAGALLGARAPERGQGEQTLWVKWTTKASFVDDQGIVRWRSEGDEDNIPKRMIRGSLVNGFCVPVNVDESRRRAASLPGDSDGDI